VTVLSFTKKTVRVDPLGEPPDGRGISRSNVVPGSMRRRSRRPGVFDPLVEIRALSICNAPPMRRRTFPRWRRIPCEHLRPTTDTVHPHPDRLGCFLWSFGAFLPPGARSSISACGHACLPVVFQMRGFLARARMTLHDFSSGNPPAVWPMRRRSGPARLWPWERELCFSAQSALPQPTSHWRRGNNAISAPDRLTRSARTLTMSPNNR